MEEFQTLNILNEQQNLISQFQNKISKTLSNWKNRHFGDENKENLNYPQLNENDLLKKENLFLKKENEELRKEIGQLKKSNISEREKQFEEFMNMKVEMIKEYEENFQKTFEVQKNEILLLKQELHRAYAKNDKIKKNFDPRNLNHLTEKQKTNNDSFSQKDKQTLPALKEEKNIAEATKKEGNILNLSTSIEKLTKKSVGLIVNNKKISHASVSVSQNSSFFGNKKTLATSSTNQKSMNTKIVKPPKSTRASSAQKIKIPIYTKLR